MITQGQYWHDFPQVDVSRNIIWNRTETDGLKFDGVTKPVNWVVFSFRSGHVWKPLGSQRGPFQSVCHHQIIQKRSILLPYFVLLIDHPLFNRIIKGFYKRQKLKNLYEVFFDNQKITGCQAQASAKNSTTISWSLILFTITSVTFVGHYI